MTEAAKPEKNKTERRLEKTIEIAVPVEEVWKALTESKELVKWFPLSARVTPGVRGKISGKSKIARRKNACAAGRNSHRDVCVDGGSRGQHGRPVEGEEVTWYSRVVIPEPS
jgi:uncharacterized protein YndB with AHSA1/START domain